MKTALSLKMFSLAAVLWVSSAASAAVVEAASQPETSASTQPVQSAGKGKSKKSRSRVRLSAMQTSVGSSMAPMPAAFNSAAAIALSPVVNKELVQTLPDKPAALLPATAASSIALATTAAESYDEETSLAQHERFTGAAIDSDALGQESVSVVDRFADKPKAKPISEGPLRVKMKDSGVRASVQIPLTQVLP